MLQFDDEFQAMRAERQRQRTASANSMAVRTKSWRPSLQIISESGSWLLQGCDFLFHVRFSSSSYVNFTETRASKLKLPRFLFYQNSQPQLQNHVLVIWYLYRSRKEKKKEVINLKICKKCVCFLFWYSYSIHSFLSVISKVEVLRSIL